MPQMISNNTNLTYENREPMGKRRFERTGITEVERKDNNGL